MGTRRLPREMFSLQSTNESPTSGFCGQGIRTPSIVHLDHTFIECGKAPGILWLACYGGAHIFVRKNMALTTTGTLKWMKRSSNRASSLVGLMFVGIYRRQPRMLQQTQSSHDQVGGVPVAADYITGVISPRGKYTYTSRRRRLRPNRGDHNDRG